MVAQSQVNDAAIGGGHRFEDLATASLDGLVGHAVGHLAQLLIIWFGIRVPGR
jgi:hypothetical protein